MLAIEEIPVDVTWLPKMRTGMVILYVEPFEAGLMTETVTAIGPLAWSAGTLPLTVCVIRSKVIQGHAGFVVMPDDASLGKLKKGGNQKENVCPGASIMGATGEILGDSSPVLVAALVVLDAVFGTTPRVIVTLYVLPFALRTWTVITAKLKG